MVLTSIVYSRKSQPYYSPHDHGAGVTASYRIRFRPHAQSTLPTLRRIGGLGLWEGGPEQGPGWLVSRGRSG